MKDWQKEFNKKFTALTVIYPGDILEELKDFISQVEADAYEKGKQHIIKMDTYNRLMASKKPGRTMVQDEAYEVAFRFWSKVERTDTCWNWKGLLDNGYGMFSLTHDKKVRAHRFSYQIMVCEIPEDKVIDHLCRNRACVNPEHMEVVTLKENILRGEGITAVNAKKTHCIRGHEYTPENTIKQNKNGRKCRECTRANQRNRRAKSEH